MDAIVYSNMATCGRLLEEAPGLLFSRSWHILAYMCQELAYPDTFCTQQETAALCERWQLSQIRSAIGRLCVCCVSLTQSDPPVCSYFLVQFLPSRTLNLAPCPPCLHWSLAGVGVTTESGLSGFYYQQFPFCCPFNRNYVFQRRYVRFDGKNLMYFNSEKVSAGASTRHSLGLMGPISYQPLYWRLRQR